MLVQPAELAEWIEAGRCVVFDCRFSLQDTEAGREAWLDSHVPGAVYAHLDDDLSSPTRPDTGRHPLPDAASFAAFLARSGWSPGKIAVVYDGGGGIIATRLWWLLKYHGIDDCALLDGGLAAWRAAALPLDEGASPVAATSPVKLTPRPEMVISTAELERALPAGELSLLDARAEARFRGEMEPLDPVAGHIPGAFCLPCEGNLENNRLRPEDQLRDRFSPICGYPGDRPVVHMCGSGVTACLNLFAMERAGYHDNRLYVGSWSEWIRDPNRPIATL